MGVREDAEGFDDLEEFFSQEVENSAAAVGSNQRGDDQLGKPIDGQAGRPMAIDGVSGGQAGRPMAIDEAIFSQPVRTSGIRAATVDQADSEPEPFDYDVDYTVPVKDDGAVEASGEAALSSMDVDEEEIAFSPKITLRKPLNKAEDRPKPAKAKLPVSVLNPASKEGQGLGLILQRPKLSADGLRHSHRNRRSPLEYWRGEGVKYGIGELGIPTVVEVVRKARSPVKRPTAKSAAKEKQRPERKAAVERALSDAGFVPEVNVTATVMDIDNDCEVERCTSTCVPPPALTPFASGCHQPGPASAQAGHQGKVLHLHGL